MITRLFRAALLTLLGTGLIMIDASVVRGCSTHGLVHAAAIDTYLSGLGRATTEFWVGVETTLVAPEISTHCSAAIGVGNSTLLPAASLMAIDAQLAIVDDSTGSISPLPQFDFQPSPASNAIFAAGADDPTNPNTSPVYPDATWFGFTSPVEPFTAPNLGPAERLQLQFLLRVDRSDLPLQVPVQFAAGEGASDGLPVLTGDHAVNYFSTVENLVSIPIPEPDPLLLGTFAIAGVCSRRGRSHAAAT